MKRENVVYLPPLVLFLLSLPRYSGGGGDTWGIGVRPKVDLQYKNMGTIMRQGTRIVIHTGVGYLPLETSV